MQVNFWLLWGMRWHCLFQIRSQKPAGLKMDLEESFCTNCLNTYHKKKKKIGKYPLLSVLKLDKKITEGFKVFRMEGTSPSPQKKRSGLYFTACCWLIPDKLLKESQKTRNIEKRFNWGVLDLQGRTGTTKHYFKHQSINKKELLNLQRELCEHDLVKQDSTLFPSQFLLVFFNTCWESDTWGFSF